MNRAPLISMAVVAAVITVGGLFILRDKNSSYQDQQNEQKGLPEMPYDICAIHDDCALVQEEHCKSVRAISKNRELQWREDDAQQTEIARRERQTCELAPKEHRDIKNFRALCRQSQCIAVFMGDLAQ